MTKTLSRRIKSAWRERRVAANAGEPPTTWFQRTVDWIDGRDGASFATAARAAKDAPSKDAFDPFAAEEAQTTTRHGASWEETTATEASRATVASPAATVDLPATPPAELGPEKAETSEKNSARNPRNKDDDARSSSGAGAAREACHPLADARRKPDFVFTMGSGAADAADAEAAAGVLTERTTLPPYQREKRSKPIGDAVSDLTQRDAAARAAARAKAEQEKAKVRGGGVKGGPGGGGRFRDVHTNITVLYPENFDAATRFARRPSDGVGLGIAGGLDVAGGVGVELAARDAKGNVIDGSWKRKWLVAFCTRWSPPCNLLVREFALLGADASLRDFALGWVDCTPASATAFCGARFAGTVEGYPTVALVAGGRIVRYSAVDRERVADAIAPWAVATAAAIDEHAPNSGEPAPGAAVPEDAPRRGEVFPSGRRGERAHVADEHGELSRARERQVREHARQEELRVAKRRREAAKDSVEGRTSGRMTDAAEATTTAPKKSKRRAAREAAEAARQKSEL